MGEIFVLEGNFDFPRACFPKHLLALPAAAGTAAASAASAAASAAALVFTTAFAVVTTMAAAEAAAEAADAATVPAAVGKASKCPEKQQTKKSQPPLNITPLFCRPEVVLKTHPHLVILL